MKATSWNTLNASLLVGGTCIGGGMLALPVGAGVGGYMPSMVWLVVAWALMTASSLLLLEVTLWMKEGDHIITMAQKFLGIPGQAIAWVLYLYICYASLVSYASGGGELLHCSPSFCALDLFSKPVWIVLFTLLLTTSIYIGATFVGRINSLFFSGMIGAYLLLVLLGSSEIEPQRLFPKQWFLSTFSLPLLLTSFSYQTMIPSLAPLLKRNPQALRISIVSGTTIALVIYALWMTLVLGIVPVEGNEGLVKAYIEGVPATKFVNQHISSSLVTSLMNFFSLFAIITSFLGICLGLFDFLADGLSIPQQTMKGKALLGTLIVIPVIYCAIYFERAFLVAMETTGGIGDALLNGLIPISMVWIGRYHKQYRSDWKLPGGKPVLLVLATGFALILIWEIVMLSTPIVLDSLSSWG